MKRVGLSIFIIAIGGGWAIDHFYLTRELRQQESDFAATIEAMTRFKVRTSSGTREELELKLKQTELLKLEVEQRLRDATLQVFLDSDGNAVDPSELPEEVLDAVRANEELQSKTEASDDLKTH